MTHFLKVAKVRGEWPTREEGFAGFEILEGGSLEQVTRTFEEQHHARQALWLVAYARDIHAIWGERDAAGNFDGYYVNGDDIPGPGRHEGSPSAIQADALEDVLGSGAADEDMGDVETIGAHYALVTFESHLDPYAVMASADEMALLYACSDSNGYIMETNEQGFVSFDAFDKADDARAKWELLSAEVEEAYGPQEDDAVISSNGFVETVSYCGSVLGEFAERDDAEAALVEVMRRDRYLPNVWFVSDHGNAHLISEEFYREHDLEEDSSVLND